MDLNGTIHPQGLPRFSRAPGASSTSLARGRNSSSARTLSAGPKLSEARDQRQDQAAESIGTSHRAKIVAR